MSQSIFISFNRKDAAAAKRIAAALRDTGFSITAVNPKTRDPAVLKQELARKINGADGLVAIISPNSVNAKRFRAETGYAAKRNKPVFPALVADTFIPAHFSSDCRDLVDASDDDFADFAAEVVIGLSDDVGDDDLIESFREEAVGRPPKRKKRNPLLSGTSGRLLALAAVLTIILIVFTI